MIEATARHDDGPSVIKVMITDDVDELVSMLHGVEELNLGVKLMNRWSECGCGECDGTVEHEWVLVLLDDAADSTAADER